MTKTKFKIEIFENGYATEHAAILKKMETHDVVLATMANDEVLTIIRVNNGHLYYRMNQMPVFVPDFQPIIVPSLPYNVESNPLNNVVLTNYFDKESKGTSIDTPNEKT